MPKEETGCDIDSFKLFPGTAGNSTIMETNESTAWSAFYKPLILYYKRIRHP